jgi:hypothetical protein
MLKPYFYSPLKIGFLIVAVAYFLFTFHAMLSLSWVGEWESFNEPLRSIVFTEDISAHVGIVARLVASVIALGGVILYFIRRGLPNHKVKKILRLVLMGEAIYWLGLLTTAVLSLTSTFGFTIWRLNGHTSTLPVWTSLLIYVIPLLIESIVLPAVLFKLSYELKPTKPVKGAIKWGLIAGMVYVFVFWLSSTAVWTSTVLRRGIQFLTTYPENLFSFALTTFGLIVLTILIAILTRKSAGTDNFDCLDTQRIGAIITILSLIYLWNYLTWIFFGKDETWSYWYLWFLVNPNLWLLSISTLGLPLLFKHKMEVD